MHKETVYGAVTLHAKKIVSLSVALDNWQSVVEKHLRKQIRELVALNYDKKQMMK